jgi:hypothetical protein
MKSFIKFICLGILVFVVSSCAQSTSSDAKDTDQESDQKMVSELNMLNTFDYGVTVYVTIDGQESGVNLNGYASSKNNYTPQVNRPSKITVANMYGAAFHYQGQNGYWLIESESPYVVKRITIAQTYDNGILDVVIREWTSQDGD